RDRRPGTGLESPGQEPNHELPVVRERGVGVADAVDDLDVQVPRARLVVGARLRGWAREVVGLRRTEAVVETRRDRPRGDGVADDRDGQQRELLQSARSAITWPTIGATRSLQAQRHRASSKPAAATAGRNS